MKRQGESLKSWDDCYRSQRRFLISYAFRMTGSLMDAEDIVQETVAECLEKDFDSVSNHRAWMTRVCSNKAFDLLKSAQRKRSSYVGTWLPDMIPDTLNHPVVYADSDIELAESLTISFLVLLQRLNSVERAVFLLKDVFGYSFREISQLIGKTEPTCRKTAERARASLKNEDRKFSKPSVDAEKMIRKFFEAARDGDQHQLEVLLSEESEFLSDGGGIVPAAPFISLKEKIVAFFLGLQHSPMFVQENYRWETAWVNARPGIIIHRLNDDGKWEYETVMNFEIKNQKIVRIFAQRNPHKLKAAQRNAVKKQ